MVRLALALFALFALAAPAADATPDARLRAFPSCAALVDYARTYAARGQGVSPGGVVAPVARPQSEDSGTVAPTASAPAAESGSDDAVSGTNVQEAGVDEPDVVKADRNRLFSLAGGQLRAVDTRGDGTPKVAGSLTLPAGVAGGELLLSGDRLLVLSSTFTGGPIPIDEPVTSRPVATAAFVARPYGGQQTTLTEVDVSDPSAMKVVRTQVVDGRYVSARLTGTSARVVVASTPRAIALPQPQTATTRAAWTPSSTLRRGTKGTARTAPLVPCDDVRRPRVFSGLGMIAVLTVDLAKGLPAVDEDAVMADGETVYASPTSLVVATQRWLAPGLATDQVPGGQSTALHRFDTSSQDETVYRGSGPVRGYLLGQYALSDSGGYLRVATTSVPEELGTAQTDSESFVTVLEEGGTRLDTVGQVGGMGRGERIRAVRFLGDLAYVVTFRQVDPLYVVDLSDPRAPKVAGSVDLLGYSAYLHPVGDGLLLGIGQDATPQGRLAGTQLSLFDVSDSAHPKLLDHRPLGPTASSTVEYDPHAFLYWAPKRLAVIPVQQGAFNGAAAFRVSSTGLTPAGRITQGGEDDGGASIDRVLVSGPRLLSTSSAGVLASRLDGLDRIGYAPFPAATSDRRSIHAAARRP